MLADQEIEKMIRGDEDYIAHLEMQIAEDQLSREQLSKDLEEALEQIRTLTALVKELRQALSEIRHNPMAVPTVWERDHTREA